MKTFLKGICLGYILIVVLSLVFGASVNQIIHYTGDAFSYFKELYFMPWSKHVSNDGEFQAACIISLAVWAFTIYVISILTIMERE